MSESNTVAQNKMGELFVEFGSKGASGLLKGLNGIQAQFLLTKNAAEQAIKPIWGMAKRVSGSVTEFNKLNVATDLSVSHLMKMKKWADLNDIEFSDYIGQIKGLQSAMREALFNRNPQVLQGFAMLGISPDQLDYKNPEKMLDMISKKIKGLDAPTKAMALGFVGLNEEMLYAMTRANKQIDKSLLLTKDQERNLQEVNLAVKELGVSWNTVNEKLIGDWENLDGIIGKVNNAIKGFIQFIDANSEKKITIVADFLSKNLSHFFKGFQSKGQNAYSLALSGQNEELKNLNIFAKADYFRTRGLMYAGLVGSRMFGNKTTMEDVENFYSSRYNGATPQNIQRNANAPAGNIGHIGKKEQNITNEINMTVNASGDVANDPMRLGQTISQSVVNSLHDAQQSFNDRTGGF